MNGKTSAEILHLLKHGKLELRGLLPWSSNYTFLVDVYNGGDELLSVYKPRQGERPLWDFAQGTLCQREEAAFVVSDALGWDLVPPTIMRKGPHGIGSLQLFVEHDPECHYFTIEGETSFRLQLQQIALLDLIINNADRKGGHILLEDAKDPSQKDRLWAIDHGVCFHVQHKLRTVVWEFAGTLIPAKLLEDLEMLHEELRPQGYQDHTLRNRLAGLLTPNEIAALENRVARVLEQGIFRRPGPGRHYPWPPV